jgi:hypothetical protein
MNHAFLIATPSISFYEALFHARTTPYEDMLVSAEIFLGDRSRYIPVTSGERDSNHGCLSERADSFFPHTASATDSCHSQRLELVIADQSSNVLRRWPKGVRSIGRRLTSQATTLFGFLLAILLMNIVSLAQVPSTASAATELGRPNVPDNDGTLGNAVAPELDGDGSLAPSIPAGGWYFDVIPPNGGAKIPVGPYTSYYDACDTFGSALFYHPFACHLYPSKFNCRALGNGFAFPHDIPFPVPANEPDAVMVTTGPYRDPASPNALKRGWYFLFFTTTGGSIEKCSDLARARELVRTVPGDEIGYYKNLRCPGAPCFSVGFDTACN